MDVIFIESSRINGTPDYVPLSGILIFVALMCFCIVLLANGAKRSVAILEQTAVSKASDATARLPLPPNAPGEAQVSSASAITQPGRHYIALISASNQSSGEASSQLTIPDQSGEPMEKLATSNLERTKAIREHRAHFQMMWRVNYRRSTANLSGRSGSFEMGVPTSLKMLIAMWRRTSTTSKTVQSEHR